MTLPRAAFAAVLGLLAALYAFAHFPGVEATTDYAGFTYKMLHPDSFPGDPYFTTDPPAWLDRVPGPVRRLAAPLFTGNPVMLSWHTLLVRAAGDRWLDDRFNLIVFFLLVVAALAALERITALFGLGPLQRLALIALVLLEHSFKDHVFQPVFARNHSPTAFAYPLALWLLYLALRADRPWVTFAAAAAGLGLSVKTTWMPGLFAILLTVRHVWKVSWLTLAIGLGLLAGAVFGAHLLHPGEMGAATFDLLRRVHVGSDADPSLEPGAGNVLYVAIVLLALWLPAPEEGLRRRVRELLTLALVAFCGGLIYYPLAPDALKLPWTMGLGVNRATWWPSLLAWIALGAQALRWIEGQDRRRILGVVALAALFGAPWFDGRTWQLNPIFVKRTLLLVGAAALVVATAWVARRLAPRAAPLRLASIAASALILAGTLGMARILWSRRAAFVVLAREGVMGDTAGAQWIEVTRYLHAHTPPTAWVFPLTMRDHPWRPLGLRSDGSLRIRSGRPMPVGCALSFELDHERLVWDLAQADRVAAMVAAWDAQDESAVMDALAAIDWPDYVIAPAERADWVRTSSRLPYAEEARVANFVILRRGGYSTAASAGPAAHGQDLRHE